ncbi:bifunctional NMN adenylyltransferase/nudix hydrolase [Acinetobacter marinus]|uniref:Bifunctional NMN adenylyltransferase/nudix hydrolase n=1 Tax=Acinetobacter marinus TaxID=281375 RepID=A0A1G6J5K3_9GAMM|nr:nicotinate-nicotinamide nucleotide adenylyltransferase [Acinetobacter marinus]SDC14020.1 bifunctional NMN adenylyltransferase/nudix hydrolase [Acinetobacter marinus]
MSHEFKRFDYLVFIGRFQPFHIAHREVIDIALAQAEQVILVLGSAQDERSIKNPFSVTERQQMILSSFDEVTRQRIQFVPIVDLYNDEKWVKAVKKGVAEITQDNQNVGLIGHFKDDSSYYLALFPEWKLLELENLKNQLSATPLRVKYYQGEIDQDHLSTEVQEFLIEFQNSEWYPLLQDAFQQQDDSPVILPDDSV